MTEQKDSWEELARTIARAVRKAVESAEVDCCGETDAEGSKRSGCGPVVILCGCGDAKDAREAT